MSKHTPGPWRIKKQKHGFCSIVYTEKKTFGKGNYFPDVASIITWESPESKAENVRHLALVNVNPATTKPIEKNLEEMAANARLIAAAPEMLELLNRVECHISIELQDEIRAIRAKIEGEE